MPNEVNRRFQFSLKTGMLCLVLIGGVFAWVSSSMHEAQREKIAVRQIQRLGGVVFFSDQEIQGTEEQYPILQVDRAPGTAGIVERFLGATYAHDVIGVELSNVTDQQLRVLEGTPRLRFLLIESEAVTDVGISHVADLTQLEFLTLHCPQLTDDCLLKLGRASNLRVLGISKTRGISKVGMAKLQATLPDCFIRCQIED